MADNFLMKGKVYGERKHLLKFPVYAEVKYDEIRLHVRCDHDANGIKVEFLSYAGKPLCNLDHWQEAFAAYFHATGRKHLDMGVLVNGNFNDSYRWVRSSKGLPPEKYDKIQKKWHPALHESMVTFYLFDVPECLLPYEQRVESNQHDRRLLQELMLAYSDYSTEVRDPLRWYVHSEEELERKFREVRELGYEGLMVKDLTTKYVSGCAHRSDGWLKMKPESEADGKIVKINQAFSINGEPLDRAGSIDVLMEDGSTASPAGLEHGLGAMMWACPDAYLGRWVEFKYMERDRQGGYRHPSFTRFREDKA